VAAYDFKVLLDPDETGGYVCTCPSLPGCYTQGDTIEAALANIREASSSAWRTFRLRGSSYPIPRAFLSEASSSLGEPGPARRFRAAGGSRVRASRLRGRASAR
jgi:predicted RNase H-like HicB family nuclease